MTSGQEMERVYSYNPGARTGQMRRSMTSWKQSLIATMIKTSCSLQNTMNQMTTTLGPLSPESPTKQIMNQEMHEITRRTRNEELAAVIVPWGLMNAGFSFAIISRLDGRMPLSTLTGSKRPTNTAVIMQAQKHVH